MKHIKPLGKAMPLRAEMTPDEVSAKWEGKCQTIVADVIVPTINRVVAVVPSWLLSPWSVVTYT